ncbi:hypothetical protein GJR88_03116 [Dietzia sp. DQ12-45-1b]|nr:hypothetical protein GJR88_03116 [Dietzia sp. DQ12-45-1b]
MPPRGRGRHGCRGYLPGRVPGPIWTRDQMQVRSQVGREV